MQRRQFLLGSGALLLGSLLPLRATLAATRGEKRLLVIVLRGAMDGLAAVVPYSDPQYRSARGNVAAIDDQLVRLDGDFAMASSLKPLADWYAAKELLFVHATAWPTRTRSHFDAQDMLENGGLQARALTTGWLSRALQTLPGSPTAVAIGPTVPLLLRGGGEVTSWAPSNLPEVDADFLARMQLLYAPDALLSNALDESQMLKELTSGDGKTPDAKRFESLMQKMASFMGPQGVARIGSIDLGGWDTHVRQQPRLTNNFTALAAGLTAFRSGMGDAWRDTAVLVVTEFGRTVKGNGTNGTDHGTGGVAFLLGGSVAGGRIVGDWPGLGKLYEERDLIPANDTRALLKGVLNQQLGISEARLSSQIFPGSEHVAGFNGLLHA